MQPRFVHLCLHTEYSLVDGLVRIKPLAAKLAETRMPALAMTDRSNLFAMVKFYRALTGAGVKPIIGVDALVRNPKEANKPHRLLLLVRNREGYLNLSRLISRSYREGQHLGLAMMDPEWFAGNCDGLIAIAIGQESRWKVISRTPGYHGGTLGALPRCRHAALVASRLQQRSPAAVQSRPASGEACR